MNFVIASFRKDLARWRQERSAFLIWLAIPLMIGGLLTLMSSGGGGGPSGTLLIDDQDETLVSGFVVGAFTQDQMGDLFVVQQVTAEEGTTLMADGEASGFLTIPKGFQDAFLNDTPVTLPLKTNPSQVILPGIIENVTQVLLDAGFYLQAVFGDELKKIQSSDGVDEGSAGAFQGWAVVVAPRDETRRHAGVYGSFEIGGGVAHEMDAFGGQAHFCRNLQRARRIRFDRMGRAFSEDCGP